MKQLDLIISASALVIGIVISWIVWSTRKGPDPVPTAKTITTSAPALPNPPVAITNGLPGSTNNPTMGKGRKGGFVG